MILLPSFYYILIPRYSKVRYQIFRHYSTKTVFALSTQPGKSAIAVIRVTGPSSKCVFQKMTKTRDLPKPRYATLFKLYQPESSIVLDHAIALWFPGPRSMTGEDMCELHLHGGQAVISATLGALATLPGFSPAEPGEFTRRAFLNGKLDLTEAEGIADLVHAETEAQHRQALRVMEGHLGSLYHSWSHKLKMSLANVEGYIDFSEDANIEGTVLETAIDTVQGICKEVHSHLADCRKGERLRNGLRISIVGEPNVGKSSLLNTLVQRDAAIVSPIAGTTRDVIESAYDLSGYPILLSDTAGLRETDDAIEKEGVNRALSSLL